MRRSGDQNTVVRREIELLAYAKGYWDGRAEGTDTLSGDESDVYRHYYRRGYDRGVFDYIELDEIVTLT